MLSLLISLILSSVVSCSCSYAQSHPPPPLPPLAVCTGSATPVVLGDALSFCGYTGVSCCDAVDDEALQKQFHTMISASKASDAACSSMAAVCTIKCRPFLSAGGTAADSMAAWPGSVATAPLPCASSLPLPTSAAASPPQHDASSTLCLDRVAEGSYSTMSAQPDGSGRVFLATQAGKIWLASMPEPGTGGVVQVPGSPFLDLTGRAHRNDAAAAVPRLLSVAFHPRFASNGRFFVSYTCDSGVSTSPAGGHCTAAAAGGGNNGFGPCRHQQLVVAEFGAAKYGGNDYSKADPSNVRKVFTMCLPELALSSYSGYNQHGGVGQIQFRPGNGDGGAYLYLVTSAKIMRLDVDSNSSSTTKMETYAMGLSNPRGCSFDPQRPSYLYCINIDQLYEQVYLISNKPPGNDSATSAPVIVSSIINHGRPAAGRVPSITGGIVYQGSMDPSLKGRYIYMYGTSAWAAMEAPPSSGHYAAAQIPNFRCSRSSPLPCHATGGISGRVASFGQDNSNDAFVLATDGVYRVASPGLCGSTPPPPSPLIPPPPLTLGFALAMAAGAVTAALAVYVIICSPSFAGGATIEAQVNCNEWSSNIMCCISMSRSGNGSEHSDA